MHNAADMATKKLANLARFVCIFMQFAVIEQNTTIIHGDTDLWFRTSTCSVLLLAYKIWFTHTFESDEKRWRQLKLNVVYNWLRIFVMWECNEQEERAPCSGWSPWRVNSFTSWLPACFLIFKLHVRQTCLMTLTRTCYRTDIMRACCNVQLYIRSWSCWIYANKLARHSFLEDEQMWGNYFFARKLNILWRHTLFLCKIS